MDVNSGLLIAAMALLLACSFWTIPCMLAEPTGGVSAALSNPLFLLSIGQSPEQCPQNFVVPATEGPYYKNGSPERSNLLETGIVGTPLTLSGYVFDRNCNPVPGAWLDFWQADGDGQYDNRGYRLRGHQFADKQAKYILRTVLPGEYVGRTSHIHVKVAAKAGEEITTSQLYFPSGKRNAQDPFFSKSMLIELRQNNDGSFTGYFNFRLSQ